MRELADLKKCLFENQSERNQLKSTVSDLTMEISLKERMMNEMMTELKLLKESADNASQKIAISEKEAAEANSSNQKNSKLLGEYKIRVEKASNELEAMTEKFECLQIEYESCLCQYEADLKELRTKVQEADSNIILLEESVTEYKKANKRLTKNNESTMRISEYKMFKLNEKMNELTSRVALHEKERVLSQKSIKDLEATKDILKQENDKYVTSQQSYHLILRENDVTCTEMRERLRYLQEQLDVSMTKATCKCKQKPKASDRKRTTDLSLSQLFDRVENSQQYLFLDERAKRNSSEMLSRDLDISRYEGTPPRYIVSPLVDESEDLNPLNKDQPTPDVNRSLDGIQQLPDENHSLDGIQQPPDVNRSLDGIQQPPDVNRSLDGIQQPPDVNRSLDGIQQPPDENRSPDGIQQTPDENRSQDGIQQPPDVNRSLDGIQQPPDVNRSLDGIQQLPDEDRILDGIQQPPDVNRSLDGIQQTSRCKS